MMRLSSPLYTRHGAVSCAVLQRTLTRSPLAALTRSLSALQCRPPSTPLRMAQRGMFDVPSKDKERRQHAPLEKEGEYEGVVVGNAKVGIRSNALTSYERSDFIGQLSPLLRPRADAGDVLAAIDTCAGHAAYTHMSGYVYGGRFVFNSSAISMATVAFNSFMFTKPVFQGDLIQLQTRVIHAGSSSIGVYVHVRRQAFDCPDMETIGESYVTMVIVDAKTLRVAPGHVPAVRLTAAGDDAHRREYLQWREEAKILTHLKEDRVLVREQIEHPENAKKPLKLRPENCVCRMDRSFGVGDVNVNTAIFGGEMLRFMEKCALHCGRVFARQARVYTLGMLDMTFDGPLYLYDLARCKAQVTCVRRTTMLVSVRVVALDANGEERSTNRASFILVAIDPAGKPLEITTGIDLEEASQHELFHYWTGRRLMAASQLRRKKGAGVEGEVEKGL